MRWSSAVGQPAEYCIRIKKCCSEQLSSKCIFTLLTCTETWRFASLRCMLINRPNQFIKPGNRRRAASLKPCVFFLHCCSKLRQVCHHFTQYVSSKGHCLFELRRRYLICVLLIESSRSLNLITLVVTARLNHFLVYL